MKLDQIGRQSDTGSFLLRLLQDSIDCNLPSVSRAYWQDSSQLRRKPLLRVYCGALYNQGRTTRVPDPAPQPRSGDLHQCCPTVCRRAAGSASHHGHATPDASLLCGLATQQTRGRMKEEYCSTNSQHEPSLPIVARSTLLQPTSSHQSMTVWRPRRAGIRDSAGAWETSPCHFQCVY